MLIYYVNFYMQYVCLYNSSIAYTVYLLFNSHCLFFVFVQVSSYPGQNVPIKLKAYDELNHTSPAVFQISLNESKVKQ